MTEARGNLLDISNLRVIFHTYRGKIRALNGVELWLNKGERLGVVGESGCGKSVTSLAITRLIEQPGEITGGKILFNGQDLDGLNERDMDKIRGINVSTIFQEPVAALNPVMKIGYQISETVKRNHTGISKKEMTSEVLNMLSVVGLDPLRTTDLYPHQLSGGMAQRVMIAIALSARPLLLIADEPTSALDVTIQIQILELLNELVDQFNYSTILITHDMGVAAEFCDKVAVMYAGNTVEYASTTKIFTTPMHPYASGLFKAVPVIGKTDELETIPGSVPDLVHPPSGCRFHPRCQHCMTICRDESPKLIEIKPEHFVACHLYSNEGKTE